MLVLDDVHAYYGPSHVLQGMSFEVPRGSIVSLLGRNGVGKTTTLRAIMGLVHVGSGTITLEGRSIHALAPYQVAQLGVQLVTEGRDVFPKLTVKENLRVGGAASHSRRDGREARVIHYFPMLGERMDQPALSLSGGEQQQLAIGRALMTDPELLMLDEPCEGLAPQVVQVLLSAIREIQNDGTTVLLVEQNVHAALELAERHYVMGKGLVQGSYSSQQLREDEQLRLRHLGVSARL